ncbi:MAG: hypothetical protein GY875_17305 [Gammaproteobacteria bacterium]|nr:hypothetical protein [Gammaproteobacteria bacterium]
MKSKASITVTAWIPTSVSNACWRACEKNRSASCWSAPAWGGYVSLVASTTVDAAAVFLMAPALYIPGYEVQQYRSKSPHIEIVHGWSDGVIPAQHSIDYAREADCRLHLIRGDHPLNSSIETVESIFQGFLDSALHS